MDVLSIERLSVRADRVVCEVIVAPGAPRCTSPALMTRVLAAFPQLARHACVNDEGDTFGAVMNATSLPHLLEHLVIDLQVRAGAGGRPFAGTGGQPPEAPASAPIFVGTTEWLDKAAGRARIEISFTDDLVALRAFRDATHFLNKTVLP